MIVTAKLKKQKDTEYRGSLEIKNTSTSDISNYTICCKSLAENSTIDSVRDFRVETTDSLVTMYPQKKTITIEAGDSIDCKFEGKGTMPTEFYVEGPPPPGKVQILYDIPMTDLTDINQLTNSGPGFTYQWSYDQMDGFSDKNPNPKYFKLTPEGLEMNLYKTDKAFKQGSPTEARTELRGLGVVLDNRTYTYSFDQFLVNEPSFDYCWCQVFGGNGPNLMLRWRSGSFQLCSLQGKKSIVNFAGKPSDDVNKWVNWKLEFVLSLTNGYCKVYRDGKLVVESATPDNSGDNGSYIKNGIYAQQEKPSNDVKVIKKNISVSFV